MMDHDDNRPDAHGGRRYHTIARANANAPVRGRVRAPVLISGLMILMLGVTVLCIPADKLRGLPLAGGATGTLVAAAIAAVVLTRAAEPDR